MPTSLMNLTLRGLKLNRQQSRSETILGGFPFELLIVLRIPSEYHFPPAASPSFFLPFFLFLCPISVRGQ